MALMMFGKLLVALGLCYQAYTLFENKATASPFDDRVATVIKSCDFIPTDIQQHIKAHLRLAVTAMLAFSALMVVFRSCWIKLPVLAGLIITFFVRHWPITTVPSFKDLAFWELIATIGGIIYLMGAEHSSGQVKHITQ